MSKVFPQGRTHRRVKLHLEQACACGSPRATHPWLLPPTLSPRRIEERPREVVTASTRTVAQFSPRPQRATDDPVRMYLSEIRKSPLLTSNEEIDLSMRMDEGESAKELLASIESSGKVDRNRFHRIVSAVGLIGDRHHDPSNG